MTEYTATVHHEKMDVDFSIKSDPESFKKKKDDDIVECFEGNGTCRKFLKNYLTMKGKLTEQPPKAKKKKSASEILRSKEPTDMEKE